MIRLFVPHDLAAGAELSLDEGQSRYLAAVMRAKAGDELRVFNGRHGEWRALVAAVGKRVVTLQVIDPARAQAPPGPDLDLVVALVKRAPLETIVEKAAELGARRVRLVVTERTNADHARVERLRAIATEAAEQTGRLDVPEVLEPVKLEKLIAEWERGRSLLFCDEAGEAPPALSALAGADGAWAILIGPEGGFSPRERETLRGLPYATAASLGPRILRADTAAISALTLWQAAAGDWRT